VSPFCLSCGEDLPLDFAGWEIEHCEVCADWPAKDTPMTAEGYRGYTKERTA
jgi:hypothetical protein